MPLGYFFIGILALLGIIAFFTFKQTRQRNRVEVVSTGIDSDDLHKIVLALQPVRETLSTRTVGKPANIAELYCPVNDGMCKKAGCVFFDNWYCTIGQRELRRDESE